MFKNKKFISFNFFALVDADTVPASPQMALIIPRINEQLKIAPKHTTASMCKSRKSRSVRPLSRGRDTHLWVRLETSYHIMDTATPNHFDFDSAYSKVATVATRYGKLIFIMGLHGRMGRYLHQPLRIISPFEHLQIWIRRVSWSIKHFSWVFVSIFVSVNSFCKGVR